MEIAKINVYMLPRNNKNKLHSSLFFVFYDGHFITYFTDPDEAKVFITTKMLEKDLKEMEKIIKEVMIESYSRLSKELQEKIDNIRQENKPYSELTDKEKKEIQEIIDFLKGGGQGDNDGDNQGQDYIPQTFPKS